MREAAIDLRPGPDLVALPVGIMGILVSREGVIEKRHRWEINQCFQRTMKVTRETSYYHIVNRFTGHVNELLFTDSDKEYAFRMLEDLNRLHSLDLIYVALIGENDHPLFFRKFIF